MSTKILDHIVHLTPPGSVHETIEQWKKLGFQVIPGGTHADGLTANALVILPDTTYIELISFTHPASHYPPGSPERATRDAHSWANKVPGFIDFALLGFGSSNPTNGEGSGDSVEDIINKRAEKESSGAYYTKTVSGGRTRPDGQILKWRITAPDVQRHGRGVLPFFCGDVTERALRVPVDSSFATHPNTAKGVAQLRLIVEASVLDDIKKQITSVLGSEELFTTSRGASWALETPQSTSSADKLPPPPQLVLSAAETEKEIAYIEGHGPGVYEVVFWAENGREGSAETPYGTVTWISESR